MNTEEAYKAMRRVNNTWGNYIDIEVSREIDRDEKVLEARENDFNFRKKIASKPRRKRK